MAFLDYSDLNKPKNPFFSTGAGQSAANPGADFTPSGINPNEWKNDSASVKNQIGQNLRDRNWPTGMYRQDVNPAVGTSVPLDVNGKPQGGSASYDAYRGQRLLWTGTQWQPQNVEDVYSSPDSRPDHRGGWSRQASDLPTPPTWSGVTRGFAQWGPQGGK